MRKIILTAMICMVNFETVQAQQANENHITKPPTNYIQRMNYKSLNINAQNFKNIFNILMNEIDPQSTIFKIKKVTKEADQKYSIVQLLTKTDLLKISAPINDDNTLRELLILAEMPKTDSQKTTILTAMVGASEAINPSKQGTETVITVGALVHDATSHPKKAAQKRIRGYDYTVNYSPELNKIFFVISDGRK
ncbi:hypothetical protein [Acinetobacter pollinis]|uniref:hypothetical protein n=1 Tax=Acinetobacter pollinis TaxID=2605270 RepID=UPI0018A327BA|nr:hypothetical protein [Acinetobacter pollinis]MBF7689591.1 hypothetical protein [Acinetobacter pollinis]MBF7698210.1 hypothetical protein [Acinetobacter pollinis]